jgi:hypothetical protein
LGLELTAPSVEVEGTVYVVGSSCKPHDCGDNTIVVLYAAEKKTVYGKLVRSSGSRLIGAPPPAVAAALERAWTSEWNQNRQ